MRTLQSRRAIATVLDQSPALISAGLPTPQRPGILTAPGEPGVRASIDFTVSQRMAGSLGAGARVSLNPAENDVSGCLEGGLSGPS